jgi:hypothetical protein
MTKLTTRKSTSTRLTDTQLIVLSRSAQREDGAATLPEGMTEKAAQKLAATLVEKGLVREIRAKSGMPVWRRSEEGRSHALIITKLGRTAINIEDDRDRGYRTWHSGDGFDRQDCVGSIGAECPTPGQQAIDVDRPAGPQEGRRHR